MVMASSGTTATASGAAPYVLCTGGLGYIGSHTVVQLLE